MYRFRYFEESMTASRTVNDYRLSLRFFSTKRKLSDTDPSPMVKPWKSKDQFAKVNLIFSPNEFQSKVLSHVNESNRDHIMQTSISYV